MAVLGPAQATPPARAAAERPARNTTVSRFDGYLLGSKSRSGELPYLSKMWNKAKIYAVKTDNWGNEPWAENAN